MNYKLWEKQIELNQGFIDADNNIGDIILEIADYIGLRNNDDFIYEYKQWQEDGDI